MVSSSFAWAKKGQTLYRNALSYNGLSGTLRVVVEAFGPRHNYVNFAAGTRAIVVACMIQLSRTHACKPYIVKGCCVMAVQPIAVILAQT